MIKTQIEEILEGYMYHSHEYVYNKLKKEKGDGLIK